MDTIINLYKLYFISSHFSSKKNKKLSLYFSIHHVLFGERRGMRKEKAYNPLFHWKEKEENGEKLFPWVHQYLFFYFPSKSIKLLVYPLRVLNFYEF